MQLELKTELVESFAELRVDVCATEPVWVDRDTGELVKWSNHVVLNLLLKQDVTIGVLFEDVFSIHFYIMWKEWLSKYVFIDENVYRTVKGGLMRQINQSKYKNKAGYRHPLTPMNLLKIEKISLPVEECNRKIYYIRQIPTIK
ncbi:hypothetical protein RF11_07569 [Thelohanellus kitauei]|uniref:Uncharacterized protein n=1 Tax=Thelohanellus kitauei TaxID=669202 RepID=A0A0C2IAE0_THEKT|nr:hypothetical protein RF11_07569 [Thelohanellus kitauei]